MLDGTVYEWRQDRMRSAVDPITPAESEARWLTLGDGVFGNDGRYILKQNDAHSVVHTDISIQLLEEAERRGLIEEFRKANAESLSFEDSSFDYAFGKLTLHHLPRPYLAVYEMLRVVRKGVVLHTGNDSAIVSDYLTAVLNPYSALLNPRKA